MALHPNAYEMLRESLRELLVTARYCVEFDKRVESDWANPGCLGYPAGVLLCCAIDTVGAACKDSSDVLVEIDGRRRPIKSSDEYFFILKSKYFQQDLDDETIGRIYDGFRSMLVHQSIVARDFFLVPGKAGDAAFSWEERDGKRAFIISLRALLDVVSAGVEKLLAEAQDLISKSKLAKNANRMPLQDLPESVRTVYEITTGHTAVTGFFGDSKSSNDK